jgi:subtilisin family serine protease
LKNAYDYAFKKGVIMVAASGNYGHLGSPPLIEHFGIIPVVACDENQNILQNSNIGISIGSRGLMAPGKDIISLSSDGGYTRNSGTSVATPFVSGSIALLWSLYPDAHSDEILYAIRGGDLISRGKRVIPPLVDAMKSLKILCSIMRR